MLLDVRLRVKDGLTLARYPREGFDAGIIMITESRNVLDRLDELEMAPTTMS